MPCWKADFHLHSCLSPCGDLLMSPSVIVKALKERGVQIAALTDHNSALNCPSFSHHCKKAGIAALFGMEVQTMEEVHVLTLFSSLDVALQFSDEIYELLPPVMNNPEKTGDQVYVDEQDDIIGEVEKFLVISCDYSIDDLAKRVHELGGIVIPAHVDRSSFSLTSQLGFVPEGDWDALEVVRLPPTSVDWIDGKQHHKAIDTLGYPLTTSSDAHYVEHVGRRPFDLDFADSPLHGEGGILNDDGSVNIQTLKKALQRRPT